MMEEKSVMKRKYLMLAAGLFLLGGCAKETQKDILPEVDVTETISTESDVYEGTEESIEESEEEASGQDIGIEETFGQDVETQENEVETLEQEATMDEVDKQEAEEILRKAFANTGSYVGKYTRNDWYYHYDRDYYRLDADTLTELDVWYDADIEASYVKGIQTDPTWALNYDPMFGEVEMEREIEEYFADEIRYSKSSINWERARYYAAKNQYNINNYYTSHDECTSKEETETEYIIDRSITYETLRNMDEVEPGNADDRYTYTVTYTVDKETEKLKQLYWKIEKNSESAEISTEVSLDITPTEDVTVTVPESIKNNSINVGIPD